MVDDKGVKVAPMNLGGGYKWVGTSECGYPVKICMDDAGQPSKETIYNKPCVVSMGAKAMPDANGLMKGDKGYGNFSEFAAKVNGTQRMSS
jgi:hypothetical protein